MLETVTIFGADCATASGAAHHFRMSQPSHSDDLHSVQEPNGLDTGNYSLTFLDDDLMVIR